MIILKYLIGALLAGTSLPDQEGWYPIEKEIKAPEQPEKEDPSIWFLFVKSVGEEKFHVRFPDEPVYRYLENGDLAISSEKEGEVFELTIRDTDPNIPHSDLLYPVGDQWVREHFLQTTHHLFHFKTLRNTLDEKFSDSFFSSISIEENELFNQNPLH